MQAQGVRFGQNPRFRRRLCRAWPGTCPMTHPCLNCGACCAHYRISFHWSEADPDLGGTVPVELTQTLRSHERALRGTNASHPYGIALDADIGRYNRCTIHVRRPSVCAQVPVSFEFGGSSPQCDKARAAHGLPPLTQADWAEVEKTLPI